MGCLPQHGGLPPLGRDSQLPQLLHGAVALRAQLPPLLCAFQFALPRPGAEIGQFREPFAGIHSDAVSVDFVPDLGCKPLHLSMGLTA